MRWLFESPAVVVDAGERTPSQTSGSTTRTTSHVYGCPIGTLCAELTKRGDSERSGAELFSTTITWAAEQFRQLGQANGDALATTMLAIVQGAALIASTVGDPNLLVGEIRNLNSWIDRLAHIGVAEQNPHDHDTSRDRSKK